MNAVFRKRLEMAVRVRDVLRFHKTDGVGEGLGLGRLEELIERAQVLLVKQGMVASLLDDLTAALGEFEKTLDASRAGRRDHLGASADLQAVAAEIKKQVRALDGMVRYRFGDNAELMRAWRSARNVLGPSSPQVQPAADEGETPAGGPDVVKPAA